MHKVELIICVLLCSLFGYTKAQNLVPNGDFEQFSICPAGDSDIDTALYWISPNDGTPDYFNQCASLSSHVGIPYNWFTYGYQYPHSGAAYSGIYLWDNNGSLREFIESPLTSSLVENTTYRFQMYVNLLNICQITTRNIGVYFSDTILNNINGYNLPYTPQIFNNSVNTFDTINWTLVSGYYRSHGGENYLVIGNFNSEPFDTVSYQQGGIQFSEIYLYVDDVSLVDSVTVGIDEVAKNTFSVYPNPANETIRIRTKQKLQTLSIKDITGREVIYISSPENIIDVSELSKGIYFIEGDDGDKRFDAKFIKE